MVSASLPGRDIPASLHEADESGFHGEVRAAE